MRTYKIDNQTADPAISIAMRKHHFYTLWNQNASRARFFEFVNQCRKDCNLPLYTREKFESGWSYRTVLHPNYKVARDECYNVIFGWW